MTFTTKQPPQGVTSSNVLVPVSIREFCRCKVLRPLLRQMRGGVTPRRLAWSLALGIVVGINPSVGLTTVLVVLLAWAFGLNQIASQIGAQAMAPLHLLLFIPFIQLGVHLFHTRRLPMTRRQIEHLSHHPLRLIRDLCSGSGTRSWYGAWWPRSQCRCSRCTSGAVW